MNTQTIWCVEESFNEYNQNGPVTLSVHSTEAKAITHMESLPKRDPMNSTLEINPMTLDKEST